MEGWVKVETFPNRKLAQDCWKVLVPLGAPALLKANVPWPLAVFSVLLYRLMANPNLEHVTALDPGEIVADGVVSVVIVVRAVTDHVDVPPVKLTEGTTPSGLGNGSAGLMSGLFALRVNPSGVDRMSLCVKLNPKSFISVGRKV